MKGNEKPWVFCSYADEIKFRGGIFIQADGAIDAALAVYRLGISPGGQMIACSYPEDKLPDEQYRNRILSKADLESLWPGEIKSLGELENESD
jgi:hypothetical protein